MAAGGASPGGSKGKAEKEREETPQLVGGRAGPAPDSDSHLPALTEFLPRARVACGGGSGTSDWTPGAHTPPDGDWDGSGKRGYPDSEVTRQKSQSPVPVKH